ncbi:Uncharacterised protein [Clostridium putrefaciens]|uniref:Uncharacterized protein n=1 Tax=Clostridium putrefaciens TaxID=99675 RepID=A0A381J7T8_9CLOT|nr:type II toxin-antitoxin system RnlB family antitoxin [Clostridium putrefaciens]SUY46516.1 Uncharacterised protein [Clostridium putrefaciens]
MKDYKIVLINNEEYSVIIYSEARRHPLDNIKQIEEDLREMKLKSEKILFDMILCRGNTTDRFIQCRFNGNSLVTSSMEVLNLNKKHNIRKLSTNYLVTDREKVENSILTSIQKKMILKGITI